MKKPRLYFDTSVFGGIHDIEFETETSKLFEMVRSGEIICVYSDLTEYELEEAPEKIKTHFLNLDKNSVEFVEITEEINQLAEEYVREKVVGATSMDDCRHIACANINNVDYLVSWNFKHIVNYDKIRLFNSINLKLGYPMIDIRTPLEFFKNEN
jgi:predicted nucleic acid-binding protein